MRWKGKRGEKVISLVIDATSIGICRSWIINAVQHLQQCVRIAVTTFY